ncbi:MAG: RNA polymerase sigma factor [Bacteroidetes bacterium]|nr:RNA polymerase sigma factor [Bacteroidota bacterium]
MHARLSRYVEAITRNREEAKDLLSETTLIAYERFEQLKNKDAFIYFLFSIASKLYKKQLRRRKWWGMFSEDKAIEIPGGYLNPETNADVDFLYKALDKMPIQFREAIVMFELTGLSIKEIAEIQSVTESAVKSRLTRGREKLASLLREGEASPTHFNTNNLMLSPLF